MTTDIMLFDSFKHGTDNDRRLVQMSQDPNLDEAGRRMLYDAKGLIGMLLEKQKLAEKTMDYLEYDKAELKDAKAELKDDKARLQDEKARLQRELDELKEKTEGEVHALHEKKTALEKEIREKEGAHRTQMDEERNEHAATIKRERNEHAANIKRERNEHAANIKRERNEHAANIERERNEHAAEIEKATKELADLTRHKDWVKEKAKEFENECNVLQRRAQEHHDSIKKVRGEEGELQVGDEKMLMIPKEGMIYAVPATCSDKYEKSTMVYKMDLPDTARIYDTFNTTSKTYQAGEAKFKDTPNENNPKLYLYDKVRDEWKPSAGMKRKEREDRQTHGSRPLTYNGQDPATILIADHRPVQVARPR